MRTVFIQAGMFVLNVWSWSRSRELWDQRTVAFCLNLQVKRWMIESLDWGSNHMDRRGGRRMEMVVLTLCSVCVEILAQITLPTVREARRPSMNKRWTRCRKNVWGGEGDSSPKDENFDILCDSSSRRSNMWGREISFQWFRHSAVLKLHKSNPLNYYCLILWASGELLTWESDPWVSLCKWISMILEWIVFLSWLISINRCDSERSDAMIRPQHLG